MPPPAKFLQSSRVPNMRSKKAPVRASRQHFGSIRGPAQGPDGLLMASKLSHMIPIQPIYYIRYRYLFLHPVGWTAPANSAVRSHREGSSSFLHTSGHRPLHLRLGSPLAEWHRPPKRAAKRRSGAPTPPVASLLPSGDQATALMPARLPTLRTR